MLHLRDRLSLKQQKALSDLAAVCDYCPDFHDDPEWDDEATRQHFEDVFKHARASTPLFESI